MRSRFQTPPVLARRLKPACSGIRRVARATSPCLNQADHGWVCGLLDFNGGNTGQLQLNVASPGHRDVLWLSERTTGSK